MRVCAVEKVATVISIAFSGTAMPMQMDTHGQQSIHCATGHPQIPRNTQPSDVNILQSQEGFRDFGCASKETGHREDVACS